MSSPIDLGQVREARSQLAKNLPRGGDGGHDGGMPPDELAALKERVSTIEVKIATVEAKIDALTHTARETQTDMKSLIKSVGDVTGKIGQMPSTWTMAGWFVTVSFGLAGLVFTIAKAMK